MPLSQADLTLLIKANDETSAVLEKIRGATEGVSEAVGRLSGAAAGGFKMFGESAEKAGAAVEAVGGHVREAEGAFGSFRETLGEVGKVIAGFALGSIAFSAAEGVKSLFESVTELGEATHKLHMEIGGSTEMASGFLAVFERWGVSTDQASVALGILSKNLTQYSDESQKAQNAATGLSGAVDRLGLVMQDGAGRAVSVQDALYQVADRFKAMPDGVEKTADAMALFGRSGRDMIPVLDQGRAGIEAAIETAQKYGLVLSTDNVEAVYKFGQAQRDLSEVVKGFAVQVGSLVLPALTSLVQGVTSLAEGFNTSVLPPLRTVVDYVSTTFGPYIAAGVEIAGQAFNGLASIVGSALSGVLSIVTSVGQAIADALSWLNPFAEHSPSLVSQVQDGVGVIGTTYASVPNLLRGPLAEAGATVASFAGDSASQLKKMSSDVKDQLAAVTDALKDAQAHLSEWGKTPLAGTKAFQDQLDAIDTQSAQIKLQIDNIKLGNDIGPQMNALNDQLRQVQLAPIGTGKGASAAHQAALRGIQEQMQALKTSNPQEQIKTLNDQLANLGLQADKVKLEEKLQLDPLRKQLKEIASPTLAEKPFKEIAAGLQRAQEQIHILTPEQTRLNDLLKAQQTALQGVTAATHASAAGHKALGGAVSGLTSPLKDVNQTVDDAKAKLADWGAKVNDARTHITTFTGGIATAVTSFPGVTALATSVKDAVGDLGDFLKGHPLNFGDLFKNIGGAGTGIGTILGTLGGGLLEALKKVFGSIDWAGVWGTVKDLGAGLLATAGNLLGSVTGWLKDTWSKIDWAGVWKSAQDIGGGIITAAGNLLTSVTGWLKDTWGKIDWAGVWKSAKDIGAGILTTGANLLTTVEKWLKETWGKVDWVGIWAATKNFISSAQAWLGSVDALPYVDALIARVKAAATGANYDPAGAAIGAGLSASVKANTTKKETIDEQVAGMILEFYHSANTADYSSFSAFSRGALDAIGAFFSTAPGGQVAGPLQAMLQDKVAMAILLSLPTVEATAVKIGVAIAKGIGQGLADALPGLGAEIHKTFLGALAAGDVAGAIQSVRNAIPAASARGQVVPDNTLSPTGSVSTGYVPDGQLSPGVVGGREGPRTVTYNAPIVQNFYGNHNLPDVQNASQDGVLKGLRAVGAR